MSLLHKICFFLKILFYLIRLNGAKEICQLQAFPVCLSHIERNCIATSLNDLQRLCGSAPLSATCKDRKRLPKLSTSMRMPGSHRVYSLYKEFLSCCSSVLPFYKLHISHGHLGTVRVFTGHSPSEEN